MAALSEKRPEEIERAPEDGVIRRWKASHSSACAFENMSQSGPERVRGHSSVGHGHETDDLDAALHILHEVRELSSAKDWHALVAMEQKVSAAAEGMRREATIRAFSKTRKRRPGQLIVKCVRAEGLAPMDTFTRKADPYLVVEVDGCRKQLTSVQKNTLKPVWGEELTFDCYAGHSRLHVEALDDEFLGGSRPM